MFSLSKRSYVVWGWGGPQLVAQTARAKYKCPIWPRLAVPEFLHICSARALGGMVLGNEQYSNLAVNLGSLKNEIVYDIN